MKTRRIAAIMIALAFCISACGKSAAPSTTAGAAAPVETKPTGNTEKNEAAAASIDPEAFHITVYRVPATLDSLALGNTTCTALAQNIYDNLVYMDHDLKWQPNVATSWEQVDATTWKFEIGEGFVFQNGEEMEMDDVVYSLTRLKDTNLMATSGSKIKDVTYEGRTLTVNMTEPDNAAMQQILSMGFIVDKSYVEETGEDALNLKPIGTGPYKVVEYEPAAKIILNAWDGYHGEAPDIKKITIEGTEDSSQRYINVETGKSQLVNNLNWSYAGRAQDTDNISLAQTFDCGCAMIVFNVNSAPFNDIRVRKAIACALDRDAWVTVAEGCDPAYSIVAKNFEYYHESEKMPKYDPAKAQELLKEAGYTASNPLKFKLQTFFVGETPLELFQASLASLGIQMEIEICTSAVYNENIANGTFEAGFAKAMNRSVTPLEDLQMFETKGVKCYSGYSNSRVDELVKEIRSATDQELIKKDFVEIQEIAAEDIPMLPICQVSQYWAYTSGLEGLPFDYYPNGWFRLAEIKLPK